MKWFKKLSRERSENHSSATAARTVSMNTTATHQKRQRTTNNNNSFLYTINTAEPLILARNRSKEYSLMETGTLRMPVRCCTTCLVDVVQRSATRLMDKLYEGVVPANTVITPTNVVHHHHASSECTRFKCSVCPKVPEIMAPDDFFDDPDEVRKYRAERKWLDEWCVIDDVEPGSDEDEDDPNGLYTTTSFCETAAYTIDHTCFENFDETSYVTVRKTPSVISLTSYTEDTFGIFHDPHGKRAYLQVIPESTFDWDIENGLILNPVSAFEEIMVETFINNIFDKCETFDGSGHCSQSSLHRAKSRSNIKLDEHQHKKKCHDQSIQLAPKHISVEQMFRLSDDGDICLNMDHIREERGYGFLMRRNRSLYKHVEMGQLIDERLHDASSIFCCTTFYRFCRFLAFARTCQQYDHPRNKPHTVGSCHDQSAGSSIGDYAYALANDPKSTFARNIQNFITCTKESRELAPQVIMRNMRQFMSGMKNYLVKHGEGDFQNEVLRARSQLKPDEFLNLDQILETVMHRLVVLPLKQHLYTLFVDYYMQSGQIQLLVDNVKFGSQRTPQDFGIPSSVTPPPPVAMQHISLLLLRLQEAALPLDKLSYLLAVVSAIFETASHSKDQALGADFFLPLLVYVVAKTEFIGAEIEAEFMYCLLQQSLLTGEAGYYLTSLCSAVQVLKGLMGDVNASVGGTKVEQLDNRANTLPACLSVLRVIIPDEFNGSLQTRTLPVRPNTTTKEVCRTIAHKARITNPQDYALFELLDGEETLLTDSECPQESRLAARGKHCMFAYKRIDAKIAWPTLPIYH